MDSETNNNSGGAVPQPSNDNSNGGKSSDIIKEDILVPLPAESAPIESAPIKSAENIEDKTIPDFQTTPPERPSAPLIQKLFSRSARPLKTEPIFHIEVEKIKPNPHQPRQDFNEDSLKELAASIREFGILQPLVVTKIEKETDFGADVEYQLIAGERRLMAVKMLGWERVPAIIKTISHKSEHLAMAIVENLQRANLNPIETARAYAKLQDEFNLTQREIATRLGKSRETISNNLRLLNLPNEIQQAVSQNKINESQARLLLSIDEPATQIALFNDLMAQNLSVRELRQRIRTKKDSQQPTADSQQLNAIDPEMLSLQERLTEILHTQVKIEKAKEGGKIIISFYSQEEIRGIIDKLQ